MIKHSADSFTPPVELKLLNLTCETNPVGRSARRRHSFLTIKQTDRIENLRMSATITFIPNEERLDISVEGNLDVTVWQSVCDACGQASPNLSTCIVDLTAVRRFFDSGIAILGLLYKRMHNLGATVVFLSDDANLRKRISGVATPYWHLRPMIA